MGSGPGPAQEAQLADNERLQQQGQHQEEQQQQQKSQEDECSSTSEPSEGTNDSGSNAQPPCGDGATGPTDATAVAIQQGSDDFISTEFYLTQVGSKCGWKVAMALYGPVACDAGVLGSLDKHPQLRTPCYAHHDHYHDLRCRPVG